jgi:hypothetical protein
MAAGKLVRYGTSQVVAVKIVDLGGCTATQVAAANKEVAIMCQVSERLGSCVVDFKGFQKEASGRLLIVMKLAKRTLMSLITETGRVPLDQWCGPGSCVEKWIDWLAVRRRSGAPSSLAKLLPSIAR